MSRSLGVVRPPSPAVATWSISPLDVAALVMSTWTSDGVKEVESNLIKTKSNLKITPLLGKIPVN